MVHGVTWSVTVDAMLDELNRRDQARQDALDALTRYCIHHPRAEDDPDLTLARIALLR